MTARLPPPFMDLPTLAEHICAGESTIENWVKMGVFPKPKLRGGKRLWRWKAVERYLADEAEQVTTAPSEHAERIRDPMQEALAKIERLQAAIKWALGEVTDGNGKWFGETYDEARARYGWRTNLRKIAGLPTYTYDKETRSIAVSNGELSE